VNGREWYVALKKKKRKKKKKKKAEKKKRWGQEGWWQSLFSARPGSWLKEPRPLPLPQFGHPLHKKPHENLLLIPKDQEFPKKVFSRVPKLPGEEERKNAQKAKTIKNTAEFTLKWKRSKEAKSLQSHGLLGRSIPEGREKKKEGAFLKTHSTEPQYRRDNGPQ